MTFANTIGLAVTLALLCVTSSLAINCQPGGNCKAPSCRCWNDKSRPGNIAEQDTPQIVVVSFCYALNAGYVKTYTDLMQGIVNPNGCPIRGSFFAQKKYSSPDTVKRLYGDRHEIGVTSSDGVIPKDWDTSFADTRAFLTAAGVKSEDITGARAPELSVGGDAELNALTVNSLRYEASCITRTFMAKDRMIWPYTLDFDTENAPECTIGKKPKTTHAGVWELIMAEMEWKGEICATPSACTPYLNNTNSDDAFEFFRQNFLKHYENRRTPFMFEINPQWLGMRAHLEGSKRFLQYIRAAYNDVWIVTNQQLLTWMMNPVPNDKAIDFGPWKCGN